MRASSIREFTVNNRFKKYTNVFSDSDEEVSSEEDVVAKKLKNKMEISTDLPCLELVKDKDNLVDHCITDDDDQSSPPALKSFFNPSKINLDSENLQSSQTEYNSTPFLNFVECNNAIEMEAERRKFRSPNQRHLLSGCSEVESINLSEDESRTAKAAAKKKPFIVELN